MNTDEPITLERQGWSALSTSGDAARAFYERVLDEHPMMLLPGGMVLDDRATIVESMSGTPWSRYTLEDERCLQPAADTAVVTYGAIAERDGTSYTALMSS